jgi:hypothetical protein
MSRNPADEKVNSEVLSEKNGKPVQVRRAPWNNKTLSSRVLGQSHELVSFKGHLELHTHDLNAGKLIRRRLSKSEVDQLRPDGNGGYILQ